jgi:hypothetical protein
MKVGEEAHRRSVDLASLPSSHVNPARSGLSQPAHYSLLTTYCGHNAITGVVV